MFASHERASYQVDCIHVSAVLLKEFDHLEVAIMGCSDERGLHHLHPTITRGRLARQEQYTVVLLQIYMQC